VRDLSERLKRIKSAADAEPYPTATVRKDRLRRAIDELIRGEKQIVEAANADFGGRHEALTLLTDVMAPVRSLRYALRRVDRWMRPDKRKPEFPMAWFGARAYIFYQPLGVVGVAAPWNAPVALTFSPLGGILAAGNRAMIKPSELTPAVSSVIASLIRAAFEETEIAVVEGGVDVAQAFTALPFDHLVFTGAAGTARTVMKAAAANLVPVTLELGGKSPAIVARGADLAYAASKIAFGKLANAGQVCMAPDFALVHREDRAGFVREVHAAMQRFYPDVASNTDFTRVHLPKQRQRLASMILEAEKAGAKIEVLTGVPTASLESATLFPPVIVLDPPLDSRLMREEVFGPVLPIVTYDRLDDIPVLTRSLSRPLALYFIGGTAAEKDFLLKNTYAGGITFDDVMLHPFMQDLPFGGVGESGTGRYLGFEGFKTFSNAKAVLQKPWIDVSRFLAPPYTPTLSKVMRWALRF
jgi:coniferyl-aldehyde dehydrogenase